MNLKGMLEAESTQLGLEKLLRAPNANNTKF